MFFFSKLGDRHVFCAVRDEGKERDSFVLITIGTREGSDVRQDRETGLRKRSGEEDLVPHLVRPENVDSPLSFLIQKHDQIYYDFLKKLRYRTVAFLRVFYHVKFCEHNPVFSLISFIN